MGDIADGLGGRVVFSNKTDEDTRKGPGQDGPEDPDIDTGTPDHQVSCDKQQAGSDEGGVPEIDAARDYPSDILDYFRTKEDIIESGHMPLHLANYLDKHHALNRTAEELTKRGLTFLAAPKLHKK